MSDGFYARYYVGHEGKFGHEFMEFEIHEDGRLHIYLTLHTHIHTYIYNSGIDLSF